MKGEGSRMGITVLRKQGLVAGLHALVDRLKLLLHQLLLDKLFANPDRHCHMKASAAD